MITRYIFALSWGIDLVANTVKASASHTVHPSNGAAPASYSSAPASSLPLPAGKDIPPGLTCADFISRTLNTLPPTQLLDVLGQMKTLASTDPQRATELLQQAPQLSYAVFQALLLMGLVSPEAIQSVVDPNATAPTPAQPPAAGYPAPIPGYPVPGATNTPPVAMPYAPPAAAPPPQAYAPPPAAPVAASQDTDSLMRAVMELPQAHIDMLPEADRQQVMALRASYAAQRR